MPQQLIYTSAPRGLVAGRSGHCTVARSATMREALMLQLEKLSYYQHLSLSGGQERPIFSCRIVDIRGSRYHVLSRIQDAGLDFTGRTNFLAQHLVFTPEEIRKFPSPPVVLRGWPGWVKSWSQEPQLLEKEDWSGLQGLAGSAFVPATNWQQVTGDAVNGYGLLESRVGTAFRVDNLAADQVLALLAESLELLELRDPRRDFRATAWQYTFTTSMQEQDNPADFRWRCLHSDNPASSHFSGPDCRPLSDMRGPRVTSEETMFARSGRHQPRFVVQPQNARSTEGETARFHAKAEGVPSPDYQWFALDRAGNGQVIANETAAELLVRNPPLGLSRYVVRASNSQGDVTSEVATLSVEKKLRLSQPHPVTEVRGSAKPVLPSYVKSEEDIERQRRRIEAEQAQLVFQKRLRRKKVLAICGAVVGLGVLGFSGWFWLKLPHRHTRASGNGTKSSDAVTSSTMAVVVPTTHATQAINTAESPATNDGQKGRLQENIPPEVIGGGANADASRSPDSSVPSKATLLLDNFTPPPTPWKTALIGQVLAKTSALADEKGFIVNGAGKNIGEKSDNFFFLHRAASNSVDFVTRLYQANNENNTRHGIMIRESEKADAAFAFVGLSQKSVFWMHRDKSSTACQFVPKPTPQLPVFLRLVRTTNSVLGAFSKDGSAWTWLGTNQVALPVESCLVGFAVSSGNTNIAVQGWFDRFTIAGGTQ